MHSGALGPGTRQVGQILRAEHVSAQGAGVVPSPSAWLPSPSSASISQSASHRGQYAQLVRGFSGGGGRRGLHGSRPPSVGKNLHLRLWFTSHFQGSLG